MQFRDANETDFEACLPLLQQLWPTLNITGVEVDIQTVQEIKEIFCRLLKKPTAKFVLTETNRQIIGLIDLTFRETLFYRGSVMIIESPQGNSLVYG